VFFLAFPGVQTNIGIHTQTYAECASVGLAHPALVDTILVQLSLFNSRIVAIASASLFFYKIYFFLLSPIVVCLIGFGFGVR